MKNAAGVYEILNIVTGERYIGSTVHFGNRWKAHRTTLRHDASGHPLLQVAWNAYSEAAFEFRVLEFCSRDTKVLRDCEQKWMDDLEPKYNKCPLAESNLGVILGPPNLEHRAKLAAARSGTTASPETRALMSVARRGNTNGSGNRGKSRPPFSVEHRANISASALARETRKRMQFPVQHF